MPSGVRAGVGDLVIWRYYALGARFAGPCLVCERRTGVRSFELARTAVYSGVVDGKRRYRVAHPECANGKTKSKVSPPGAVGWRIEPDATIEAGNA